MEKEDFQQKAPCHWILEKNKCRSMRVNAEVFASEQILAHSLADNSIQQVINVASLPEIVRSSLAMPDIHYGYGFCIGGVAAFPADTGIVLPGGVGYDINCGVRLLATDIPVENMDDQLERLGYSILNQIPTGLSSQGGLRLNRHEFNGILRHGAREIVDHYQGEKKDLRHIESSGALPFDMPEIISQRAIERGKTQVGSLGSGNHFIEIQLIEEVFDQGIADTFTLGKGNLAIMIHTGSRGFGHQIASDAIEAFRKKFLSALKVKDPQLIHAPIHSVQGRQYLQALNAASNFAWANRHLLMENLIAILEKTLGSSREQMGIRLVYDQAHNIAKFEDHPVGGKPVTLLVHRKGATRAFGPGHPDLPKTYRQTGQPVILPGSMGTASYVMHGTQAAMDLTFGSSAHGAGRRMSRHKAIQYAARMDVSQALKQRNILAFSHSARGLKEEIPQAYKDIDEVAEITRSTGISGKVARLVPLVVIKG